MNTKHLGLKLLLIGLVCFAALFNLETSPFRYLVPAAPFTDSPGGQLAGDTYVYLYTGGLIPKGLMPYRDFFDHKGPLLYLIMALGITIGREAGVWLIQSVFLFAAAFFAYKTARLLTGRRAAAAAAALAVTWYSLGETGPDTFAVPFLLAGLYSLVRFVLSGWTIRRAEAFGVGVSFAAVLLMKMNLVSLWIVFTGTVIVSSVIGRRFRFLLERTAFFLAGAALVILPVLAWLWLKGSFDDFVRVYLKFNLTDYGDPPPFGNGLLYFIPMIFRRTLQAAVHWSLYFCYNLPAFLTYFFLFLYEKNRPRKILFGLLAAMVLLSVHLIGAKGWHFVYYCYPMTADYLIFFALAFEFIFRIAARRRIPAAVLFLLLTAPALRALAIPPVTDWVKRQWILHADPAADLAVYGRPIRTDRGALDLARYLRENTPPDARINGVGCSVYWYADRICACPFLFEPEAKLPQRGQLPLSRFRPLSFLPAQRSSRLTFYEDGNGNPPEYIFEQRRRNPRIGRIAAGGKGSSDELETSPEIEARLNSGYELVYQNGQYDLYRLKPR